MATGHSGLDGWPLRKLNSVVGEDHVRFLKDQADHFGSAANVKVVEGADRLNGARRLRIITTHNVNDFYFLKY